MKNTHDKTLCFRLNQIKKFENQNNISINVYYNEKKNSPFDSAHREEEGQAY